MYAYTHLICTEALLCYVNAHTASSKDTAQLIL